MLVNTASAGLPYPSAWRRVAVPAPALGEKAMVSRRTLLGLGFAATGLAAGVGQTFVVHEGQAEPLSRIPLVLHSR